MSDSRLSHAFPPDSKKLQYHSKIHSILPKIQDQIHLNGIYYRSIKNDSEMEEIKALHKEWFPIDYNDEFYEEIRKGITKCILALYDVKSKENEKTIILGLITYRFRNTKHKLVNYDIADIYRNRYAIYILTLGVVNEIRKIGLATKLIDKLLDITRANNKIKYIYLHVIEYNDTAIKFYERNKFQRIVTEDKHYNIDGKLYDAYIYIYYTNGGRYSLITKDTKDKCLSYIKIWNAPKYIFNAIKNMVYALKHLIIKKPAYKPID